MSAPAASRHSLAKVLLIWTCFFAAPIFIAAGTLEWWSAWAFLLVNFVSITYVNWVVYPANPDLAAERAAAGAKTKKYDKILVPLTVALLPMASNILAGLDKRFGWTDSIAPLGSALALAIYILSTALVGWSMKANRFFSSHFSIQSDRGHTVASQGPYAIVRHPGYLGMVAGSVALPALLGSVPALGVGVLSACLGVLRTAFEDRALQAELPGYREYAGQVRYRLLPRVW